MEDDIRAIQAQIQKAERLQRKAFKATRKLHKMLEDAAIKHEADLGISIQSVIPKNPEQ